MIIGLKNRRVRFETPTTAADAEGGIVSTWAAIDTVWASVSPLQGEERLIADQVAGSTTHRIRVRYSAALGAMTSKDRAVVGSRIFDLTPPLDLMESHRELEIMAKERTT
jgi:SPP1 family predicted phage head-tail adaptor